jgi:DNA invertase Pin-like site-specific DNA recombinase
MIKQHAIYMRVSTRRQDTASQEPELRRWAESHEGESHWYRDISTGTSMDRPGFRQMMRDIEAGRVDNPLACPLSALPEGESINEIRQREAASGEKSPRSRSLASRSRWSGKGKPDAGGGYRRASVDSGR